ncbi:MAG: helix-turn-helix transcriptional regulator [Desulfobulbus sp.]|nr:helix-turn-helix transcriptional regulator [Desulfobulbus sp.]
MDNPTVTIDGKKLRLLREQQKLTQLFLATTVEVTTETISRWENNKHPTIKRENAEKLAEALNVPLTVFLKEVSKSGTNPPSPVNATSPAFIPRLRHKRTLLTYTGIILFLLLLALSWYWARSFNHQQIGAFRFLPGNTLPQQPFPVFIRIETMNSPRPLMVRENLPDPCRIITSLPPCMNADDSGQQLKWLTQDPGGGRYLTITYMVQPGMMPMGKELFFTGNIVTGRRDSGETPVLGVQSTKIAEFHWADGNKDHKIDDYELLSVFELFPKGEQLGIDLAEIKAIWAGNGYQWDQQNNRLVILSHLHDPSTVVDSE